MKKVVFFVSALLLAASLSAVEVAPSAAISGSATTTFGYDLDNNTHGFTNATSGDLKITLVAEATESKGEGEDVYGWIELSKFKSEDLTQTDPGVSAKIFVGPIFVTIGSKYGSEVDLESYAEGKTVDSATGVTASSADIKFANTIGAGLGIGLVDTSMVGLEIGVGSNTAGYTNTNQYSVYAKLSVNAVENLGLAIAVGKDLANATDIGFGAEVSYAMDKLSVGAAVDVLAAATTSYSVGFGVAYALDGAKMSIAGKSDIAAGFALGLGLDHETDMDLTVQFIDGDVIPVLDLGVIAEVYNLLAAGTGADVMDVGLAVRAAVAQDAISAWLESKSAHLTATTGLSSELTVGVSYTGISLTTLSATYTSGNLAATTPVKGKVVLEAKVAF